jgi:hypothetical protein
MSKFKMREGVVTAVQLLWSTWNEVCEVADVGEYENDESGRPQGCYVDRVLPKITSDCNGRIGLMIPDHVLLGRTPRDPGDHCYLAIEGDWIVRLGDGKLAVVHDAIFREQFDQIIPKAGYVRRQLSDADAVSEVQHALSGVDRLLRRQNEELQRATSFEVDWKKYPKLVGLFPQMNVYWEDLQALLIEARADAVRCVRDARPEELQKARADPVGTDPGAVSVRELGDKQLITALRNVGCYLDDCDACAEVFFTGSKTHDHTCPKGR